MFHRFWTNKMVIWKERENKIDDAQVDNDPMNVMSLRECSLLKYSWVSSMRAHVRLLEHMIRMWNPYQKHFYILIIDVEDIYVLTGLS